jgi:uncharacterized protein YoxC
MYTGQIMIYAGIALVAVAFIMFIIVSICFRHNKSKLMKKIYESYE